MTFIAELLSTAASIFFIIGMIAPKKLSMSRKKVVLLTFGLIVASAIIKPKDIPLTTERRSLPKDVTDVFLTPDSKIYKIFGKTRSEVVEKERIAFAQSLLDEKKCKTIEYVAVSEKSTKNQAKFFADCIDPKERFFKDEERSATYIAEDTTTTPVKAKISISDALAQCRSMISTQTTFKSKLDFSFLNTGAETLPNGTTQVVIGFDAMNGLGNMLPYTALCEFPPNDKATINIQKN